MDKQVRESLKALASAIQCDIEYPNHGGCGAIASIVARALEEKGHHVEIVVLGWSDRRNEIEKVLRHARDPYDPDYWRWHAEIAHVVVRIDKKYYFDSNGLRRKSCPPYEYWNFNGRLPLDLMEYLSLDYKCRGMWNRMFNRKQIPKIHMLVDQYLGA